jgi:hypothetical protein
VERILERLHKETLKLNHIVLHNILMYNLHEGVDDNAYYSKPFRADSKRS